MSLLSPFPRTSKSKQTALCQYLNQMCPVGRAAAEISSRGSFIRRERGKCLHAAFRYAVLKQAAFVPNHHGTAGPRADYGAVLPLQKRHGACNDREIRTLIAHGLIQKA